MSDRCVLCGKKIKTRYMLTKLTDENSLVLYNVYITFPVVNSSTLEESVLLPICEKCLKKRLGDVIVVEKL